MSETAPEATTNDQRDPDVTQAIENARKAQAELDAAVRDSLYEAFDGAGKAARVDTIETKTYFFESPITWTDVNGNVVSYNTIRVDRVGSSNGDADAVKVYAATYIGDVQTASNPGANPLAELPVELADHLQN